MRVNARFDDESAEQVDYLTRATGLAVSEVLRQSVALYYRQIKTRKTGLKHLGPLIGKGDSGHTDTASNVKKYIGEYLEAKHGLDKR